jgi:hypothetical protein
MDYRLNGFAVSFVEVAFYSLDVNKRIKVFIGQMMENLVVS